MLKTKPNHKVFDSLLIFVYAKHYQAPTPAHKLELDPDNNILKDSARPLRSHLFQLDTVPPQARPTPFTISFTAQTKPPQVTLGSARGLYLSSADEAAPQ